jgi:hypothetical protein
MFELTPEMQSFLDEIEAERPSGGMPSEFEADLIGSLTLCMYLAEDEDDIYYVVVYDHRGDGLPYLETSRFSWDSFVDCVRDVIKDKVSYQNKYMARRRYVLKSHRDEENENE